MSRALQAELMPDILAHLITATANARSDRGDNIFDFGAELRLHAPDRFYARPERAVPRHPACTAATARVTVSASRIGKQSAVRTETITPGSPRQQRIALSDTPFASIRHKRQRRMNLS